MDHLLVSGFDVDVVRKLLAGHWHLVLSALGLAVLVLFFHWEHQVFLDLQFFEV